MPDHGTVTMYSRGRCRCLPCRTAANRYKKRWRHLTKAGPGDRPTEPRWVPSEPVRAHVAALVASGWRKGLIAAEIGISIESLWRLTNRSARCTRENAARILALEPLRPVDLDPVVVERLATGGDWRALSATRAERLAAYEAARRAGESGKSARRRLGLAGRDTAVREAS